MEASLPNNADIADALERVGDLLEAQGENVHRVRAYRRAATGVRTHPTSVADLARGATDDVEQLFGIGRSIGACIRELVTNGRLRLLERLEGAVSPEDLFATVPGIGDELAARIHAKLGIDTLEQLELAAHDGRLERVRGFGRRRTRAVREELASMLSRSTRWRARAVRAGEERHEPHARPAVGTILAIDAEYRQRAERGELRTIRPRRFNPRGDAWLPILHTERDGWAFTAMFSNTAMAHRLGHTRDWVVVFDERGGHEDQCTIVSEIHGALSGWRVVRGRERECAEYYRRTRPARIAAASDATLAVRAAS